MLTGSRVPFLKAIAFTSVSQVVTSSDVAVR
jgi:hypothetical protein